MWCCAIFASSLVLTSLLFANVNSASAQCPALSYQLANRLTADAMQVTANFNQLLTCLNLGELVVPPVLGLGVTGLSRGTATIQNPRSGAVLQWL